MYIAEFRQKLATSGDEHLVELSKVSDDQLEILLIACRNANKEIDRMISEPDFNEPTPYEKLIGKERKTAKNSWKG